MTAAVAPDGRQRPPAHRVPPGRGSVLPPLCTAVRSAPDASSFSSGVRKLGITRTSPIHSASREASSGDRGGQLGRRCPQQPPVRVKPSARWAHPPTIRPSHQMLGPMLPVRSNMPPGAGGRYQSRPNQPIGVGSSAGNRAIHGCGHRLRLDVVGEHEPRLVLQVDLSRVQLRPTPCGCPPDSSRSTRRCPQACPGRIGPATAGEISLRPSRLEPGRPVRQPFLDRRPLVVAARPLPAGPPADDPALRWT